jgi:hypothetical protein
VKSGKYKIERNGIKGAVKQVAIKFRNNPGRNFVRIQFRTFKNFGRILEQRASVKEQKSKIALCTSPLVSIIALGA